MDTTVTTVDWQPLSVETVADWAELTNLLAVVDGTEEFYDADALAEELREPGLDPRLDTTMVGTPYLDRIAPVPPEVLAGFRELGDRIVLGSDFPNIPYPYARQVQSLIEWNFGEDWLRQVLWHNGAELMGF